MSVRLRLVQNVVVKVARRLETGEPDLEKARRSTARTERAFRLARGVSARPTTVGGVPGTRYSSGGDGPGVVLHLHGGAFFCGSSNMGRRYSPVSADGGPDVVSIDYRLAPEDPYPAGLDDALAAYTALAADGPVAVMGDSAGGGLVLSLVQRVRDEGLPLPVAVVAMFPYADLTHTGASYDTNAGRDMLSREGLSQSAERYAPGRDVREPGVSPIFGSFAGFPPTHIVVGQRDSLLDDARGVAAALRSAGADVTLVEVPDAIHGFTTFPVPEARDAIAAIAGFLRRHLGR